nr:uncharacterized protein LOC104114380 [Nicotiana tomentosiformis]
MVIVEKDTKMQLEKWLRVEESIMKQKSRVQWLNLGDANTTYFFASMKIRYSQNKIKSLIRNNGEVVQTKQEIEEEVLGFYKQLLGSATERLTAINPVVMRDGLLVNRKQQLQLAWPMVGDKITDAVMEFFSRDNMYQPINCTIVTLVPKGVMDDIVDRSQSSFVPRRLINDNIIMSHELVKGYGRKGLSPRYVLKVDMKKAYDSIEWDYMEQVLKSLQLPGKFVHWIIRGDTIFVQLLYQSFQEFSQAYGLVANAEITTSILDESGRKYNRKYCKC